MNRASGTVVVGMSGGVDSSVSALLLKEQGYNVIGVFMKNWDEQQGDNECPAAVEFADVVRVCKQLDIPYYSVNFVKEYWDNVFSEALVDFNLGHTPNPDVLCNKEIKFKVLLKKALELGGDYLATGHYSQVGNTENTLRLLKGADSGKDQSYFLYTLTEQILDKVLFPIGHLQKSEVREIARKHGLATAEKADSTGLCFIGERNFKQFLKQYIPTQPGNFEDLEGNILGQHDGFAFYTPGQRKGLGIGGAGDAWYVVRKDLKRNVVILAQGARHPALYCDNLVVSDVNWINLKAPQTPFICQAKIRYRQQDQDCIITKIEDDKAWVIFPVPQRAITLRQAIVFYHQEICLGGGIIESHGQTYYESGLDLPSEA